MGHYEVGSQLDTDEHDKPEKQNNSKFIVRHVIKGKVVPVLNYLSTTS
jgi:hypothetical protein